VKEEEAREIIEKVTGLNKTEQATIIGVIRGIELAKSLYNQESSRKSKKSSRGKQNDSLNG
jgi:hypothetical protein